MVQTPKGMNSLSTKVTIHLVGRLQILQSCTQLECQDQCCLELDLELCHCEVAWPCKLQEILVGTALVKLPFVATRQSKWPIFAAVLIVLLNSAARSTRTSSIASGGQFALGGDAAWAGWQDTLWKPPPSGRLCCYSWWMPPPRPQNGHLEAIQWCVRWHNDVIASLLNHFWVSCISLDEYRRCRRTWRSDTRTTFTGDTTD